MSYISLMNETHESHINETHAHIGAAFSYLRITYLMSMRHMSLISLRLVMSPTKETRESHVSYQ